MARITTFQGGSIQPDAPSVTPFRAPDFGPGIGPGIEKLGQGIGEAAQKVDEIQDIHARIEANKGLIAYNTLATTISQRVRSTLGDQAPAAADKGLSDLMAEQSKLLAGASPRARKILEPEFANRTNEYRSQWWEHGFEQNKQAFYTSSAAANDHDLEAALQQSTDEAAKPYLDSIRQRNSDRARFFGLGPEWKAQEDRKAVSSFYKSRALTLGVNSAGDAIKYAMSHRGDMDDGDFSAIVQTYRDEALDETAEVEALGFGRSDAPTTQSDDGEPIRTADPKMVFNGLILPNEGSALVHHDSNGAPVRYGINQKANPDVDVANLTQAGAQKLFIDRYWKPSGADKLPPALAVVHADTYYLNEKEAGKLLKQSGGDVQKYMELRDSWLAALHASNPAKYPDYTKRNERVEQYASALGGDGTPFSFTGRITDKTSMSGVEDEVMARKDLPLALKTRILRVVRERREMLRSDKRADEEDAKDTLVTAMTNLGDKFTSIKQLPQDALSRANPETIHSLTEMARNNGYKKADESLRPLITETEILNPNKFMSKDFILELGRKGASPTLIGEVQNQQMEYLKKQQTAKPDVIADGTLWGVAKTPFEAAGLDFDGGKKNQKQANAQAKEQALTYLRAEATDWANAHPGEKATPEIMRQWVGAALLKTKSGAYAFQAKDEDIYNTLSEPVRNTIIRSLRRNGDTTNGPELISHVVKYYSRLRSLYGTGPIDVAHPDRSAP